MPVNVAGVQSHGEGAGIVKGSGERLYSLGAEVFRYYYNMQVGEFCFAHACVLIACDCRSVLAIVVLIRECYAIPAMILIDLPTTSLLRTSHFIPNQTAQSHSFVHDA